MRKITAHAKILSLLLAFVMVMSTMAVFAEGETTPEDNGSTPSITLNAENVTIKVGEETDLAATTNPVDAEVTWTSDHEEFATVANGKVTGVSPGSAKITASITVSVEGKDVVCTAECDVNVSEPSVTVSPASPSVEVGKTTKLTANAENYEGTPEWSWSSSADGIAKVAEDGTVTGVAAGTATITASFKIGEKEYKGECQVTVTAPAPPTFTKEKPVLSQKKKYDKNDYEGAKDNGYTLNWKQKDRTGVTGYQILHNNAVVATVGANASSYEILAPAGTSNYAVKAVGNNKQAIASNTVTIKVSGVVTSTHAYTWYCKTKKKIKTGGVTIPKGTTLVAVGRSPKKIKKFRNPKKVQVIYKKKKVWVPYGALKGGVKPKVSIKKDYSRSLKEYMVNNAAFSQKTKEDSAIRGVKITSHDDTLIWACLYTQRAYTFKRSHGKWVLTHSDRITTGKFSHPTRSSETSGIYTINKKKSGKVWMVQENGKRYYFTHASYITKGISFHTGTWWASGKKRGSVIPSGRPGTYGCIRMYTNGAKYIFANTTKDKTGVIVTRFD